MKYSSLECGKFILAFQLQFGIYEAESERFRWEKEKYHLNEFYQNKQTFYILVILLMFYF